MKFSLVLSKHPGCPFGNYPPRTTADTHRAAMYVCVCCSIFASRAMYRARARALFFSAGFHMAEIQGGSESRTGFTSGTSGTRGRRMCTWPSRARARACTHLRANKREGAGTCARDTASNVGDVQAGSPANTLGRLRIMMPYCIQIRIPTMCAPPRRCTGIGDSFVRRGNAAPPGGCARNACLSFRFARSGWALENRKVRIVERAGSFFFLRLKNSAEI